jgi:hypothetical protein
MIHTSVAHTNDLDKVPIDARRGVAHDKLMIQTDSSISFREEKTSNRGNLNKEGEQTATFRCQWQFAMAV